MSLNVVVVCRRIIDCDSDDTVCPSLVFNSRCCKSAKPRGASAARDKPRHAVFSCLSDPWSEMAWIHEKGAGVADPPVLSPHTIASAVLLSALVAKLHAYEPGLVSLVLDFVLHANISSARNMAFIPPLACTINAAPERHVLRHRRCHKLCHVCPPCTLHVDPALESDHASAFSTL